IRVATGRPCLKSGCLANPVPFDQQLDFDLNNLASEPCCIRKSVCSGDSKGFRFISAEEVHTASKSTEAFRGYMKRQLIEDLTRDLSRRRSLLLQDAAQSQDEMKAIFEQQESEFEESAQKDRITRLISRLKERDRQKIKAIDAALTRIETG